jgi:hypothetical protein
LTRRRSKHETDEEEEPPRRRRTSQGTFFILIWVVCLGWTAIQFFSLIAGMTHANGAIQEAAVAAAVSAQIIAGYVAARCLHHAMLPAGFHWDEERR